ncbi:MAG: hypothetical protein CM1200mP39_29170 [Dehalococcoidia bacterium]|nr:MAG: hypothetical protein CM1200mP39_29170 [Dehalococcoidia bacterium]
MGRAYSARGSVSLGFNSHPYWSRAHSSMLYGRNGGMDKLKGKRIAHVFHNSAYGKEANPTLQVLSEKYGFDLMLLAVDHPGQEQRLLAQIRKKARLVLCPVGAS